MKTLFTSLASLAFILFLILALPVSGEEDIYDGVLRLHVLAASDSAEDQAEKIRVRDALLDAYGEKFAAFGSREEAEAFLREHLPEIKEVASAVTDSSVCVSLGEEWFDTRSYGEFTLPAGNYTSLTVTLGEGEGQNFWCMLYPALCTESAKGQMLTRAQASLDAQEYLLITDTGYAVKFRSLELLSRLFR